MPSRAIPAWPRLRALLLLLSVLACACGASPPPRALVMRDVSFPLRDMRFPSGLRVIVEEDHRSPVVGVLTLVGAGSTSDPPGKEGLAHYVEHLSFRARRDGAVVRHRRGVSSGRRRRVAGWRRGRRNRGRDVARRAGGGR